MKVSFDDCCRELVVTREHENRLRMWQERPATWRAPEDRALQETFIDKVRNFEHRALFEISPSDVIAVASRTGSRRTAHALGALEKGKVNTNAIRDFPTPFAQTFFFHDWLERNQRIPRWQDLWPEMLEGTYRCWYFNRLLARHGHRYSVAELRDGFQWRFGLTYYSSLRELFVFTVLRHTFGIRLKYHLFADLNLAVDGWIGNKLMCLWLPNDLKGRKREPAPGGRFEVVNVNVLQPAGGGRGYAWLPEVASLAGDAAQFNEDLPAAAGASAGNCPDCGGPVELKRGRRGDFWSCVRWPACRGSRDL